MDTWLSYGLEPLNPFLTWTWSIKFMRVGAYIIRSYSHGWLIYDAWHQNSWDTSFNEWNMMPHSIMLYFKSIFDGIGCQGIRSHVTPSTPGALRKRTGRSSPTVSAKSSWSQWFVCRLVQWTAGGRFHHVAWIWNFYQQSPYKWPICR